MTDTIAASAPTLDVAPAAGVAPVTTAPVAQDGIHGNVGNPGVVGVPGDPSAIVGAAPTPAPTTPEPAPKMGAWPDDWRDKFAEALKPGDEAFRKRLERFAAPTEVGKSWLALESKQSSGELKRALPKDATPEETAAWRKDNGLPDSPEGYKPIVPEGVILGEADKATLEGFQKFAFEKNLAPEAMNETLNWYFAEQAKAQEALEIADMDYHESAKEALIDQWGSKDYRTNIAVMATVRDQMPQGLADRMFAGRTADGHLIGDDPQFLQWFAQLARELSPQATLVSAGVDNAKNLSDQLETIQRTMREDPQKYWKDTSMQERYRTLLETRDKFQARQ